MDEHGTVELEHEHHGHGGSDGSGDRTAFAVPLIGALVVLALVIGVITALGGSDDDEASVSMTPMQRLAAVPDATAEARTARMSMTLGLEGTGMQMSFDGDGAIDFTTGAGHFTMSMMGLDFEIVATTDTMYLRLPEMGRPPSIEQEWIGVPIDAVSGGGSPVMGFGGSPAAFLETLRGVTGEIEELGTESVNGVAAEHYRFAIDVQMALGEVSEEQRAKIEAAFEQLGSGLTEIPMDLWLNEDGLPVRQLMTMDMAGVGTMRMQVDFTDFGADVDVAPPPDDEVYFVEDQAELDDLMGASVPA